MNFKQRLQDERDRHENAIESLVEDYLNEYAIYPVGTTFEYEGETCTVTGRRFTFDIVKDPDAKINENLDIIYFIDIPQWRVSWNPGARVVWPQYALQKNWV